MGNDSIGDKMLQAVLSDEMLRKYAGYEMEDCVSLSRALISDNCIVRAVAIIIERGRYDAKENEIYKEVSDYLKRTI